MEFRKINIEDKNVIQKFLDVANEGICEHCFTDIFMWQNHYNTMFCVDEDFLYIKSKSHDDDTDYYMCPVGASNIKKGIEKVVSYAKGTGNDFAILSITENLKEKIEKEMPNEFDFYENRDSSDYIYLSEKLITLSGKKLHSKRNFINRFETEFENRWHYEDMNDLNRYKAWEFHQKWHKDASGQDEVQSLLAETCAIKKVIDNYKELNVLGGLLYIDQEVVGFTLATKSTKDMYVIQIEKGDVNFVGVYPMINKMFAKNNCFDATFINREEDLGIEGLRKAKLSYRPEEIRTKYIAKVRGN